MGELAFGTIPTEFRPRSPEKTVLYQTVANHLNSFYAVIENEEKRLPEYVRKEFDAFLRCGIHAYGFLRLKCSDCSHERMVAFSCKKRGFCNSCGGRRMSESAAHLVDKIFPFPIRFILARSPALQSKVLGITLRAIHSLIQSKAKKKIQGGAITLLQRSGGSLNLNLHLHMLVLEGGYVETPEGPKFEEINVPTDEEIKNLVVTIAKRVIRALKKKGYFKDEHESIAEEEDDSLGLIQAASVKSRVALGKRRGDWIRRIGSIGMIEAPELSGPLCANISGFSLHAAVYCPPENREKLEQLCRPASSTGITAEAHE